MSAVSLSNPLRPVLLAAARSSRLEKTVSGMTLTRKLVDRFVAGDAEPAAMSAVRDILTSGRFVTVDYLGEDTTDPAQATATVDAISPFSARTQRFPRLPGRNTPWRFRSSSPRWGSHFPVTARRSPWRTLTESSQRQTKWARGSPSMRRITPPPTRHCPSSKSCAATSRRSARSCRRIYTAPRPIAGTSPDQVHEFGCARCIQGTGRRRVPKGRRSRRVVRALPEGLDGG